MVTPIRRLAAIRHWWPVFLWSTIILCMSSVPGSRLDEVGFEVSDKLIHAVEYAVLGALALWCATRGRGVGIRAALLAFVIATGVGAVDENYQRLIPQRESSAMDWAADVAGAAIGVGLAAGVRGRGRRDRRRS